MDEIETKLTGALLLLSRASAEIVGQMRAYDHGNKINTSATTRAIETAANLLKEVDGRWFSG